MKAVKLRPSVAYRTGELTQRDYDEAIEALVVAMNETDEDKSHGCIVCWSADHSAKNCHHNPLVVARRYAASRHSWRCFHCGELFTTKAAARKHFGKSEDEVARCLRQSA